MICKGFPGRKKEKNLKNCLAERSRAGYFCSTMSWTSKPETKLNIFVSEGMLLILQW